MRDPPGGLESLSRSSGRSTQRWLSNLADKVTRYTGVLVFRGCRDEGSGSRVQGFKGLVFGSFRKLGAAYFGGLIIRILLFRMLD